MKLIKKMFNWVLRLRQLRSTACNGYINIYNTETIIIGVSYIMDNNGVN